MSASTKVRLAILVVLGLAAGATLWAGARPRPAAAEPPPSNLVTARAELEAGNKRFVNSHRTRSAETRADGDRRKELVKGQKPIAAVLACADSRVPPELVFDQGLGRLFVVRNAGNVVDGDVLGSLEYAVEHLDVPLIVVLGHTGCGAVTAVSGAGDKALPHHLEDVQKNMTAVRDAALKAGDNKPDDFLAHQCETNARAQAHRLLAESSVLRGAVKKKETAIAVAVYDLSSGAVKWLDFDPDAEK